MYVKSTCHHRLFACLLWVIVCFAFALHANWAPCSVWQVCQFVLKSFLPCWLLWGLHSSWSLCLLCFFLIVCVILILVLDIFLKVCWSCPLSVKWSCSWFLPIVVNPPSSCLLCWWHHCCSFWSQSFNVRPIIWLFWYVKCCTWLYVDTLPQVSFSDPVIRVWCRCLWSWYCRRCWLWLLGCNYVGSRLIVCLRVSACAGSCGTGGWCSVCVVCCGCGWGTGVLGCAADGCVAAGCPVTLNQVSPVQASPCRIRFCAFLPKSLYRSTKSSLCLLGRLTIVLR